jgi:hypothetical protein
MGIAGTHTIRMSESSRYSFRKLIQTFFTKYLVDYSTGISSDSNAVPFINRLSTPSNPQGQERR